MKTKRLSRREFLKAATAAAGAAQLSRVARAESDLVVVGWGGDYQDFQRQAYVEPFVAKSGVKVNMVTDTGSKVALIKAQVETDNPEWDVIEVLEPDGHVLKEGGYLAEIEYDKEVTADYGPGFLDPHMATFIYGGFVLAWSTKVFPGDEHPKNWVDYWDVKKFPGPRTAWSWYPYYLVETALMGAGTPMGDIYPLDDGKIKHALNMWRELHDSMHVWWGSGSQSQQLLADGEVVLWWGYETRVRPLKAQGYPVNYTLNQGLRERVVWVVPKSSRNQEAASRFINFTLRPEPQAEMVRLNQYAMTNVKAYDLLADNQKMDNMGYPPNLDKSLLLDGKYWSEAYPRYAEEWENVKTGN